MPNLFGYTSKPLAHFTTNKRLHLLSFCYQIEVDGLVNGLVKPFA